MRGEPVSLSAHLRPRTPGNPGKGPIYVDASQKARLRWREDSRPVTQDWPTLQEAVLAFYRLPEDRQDGASIVLARTTAVYRPASIRRLHHGPRDDERSEAQGG